MALIPPFFLDCVVAIGVTGSDGSTQWVASGFLYGDHVKEKAYRVFLVSNRHVFEGQAAIKLRFNPEEYKPAQEFDLTLQKTDGTPIWHKHADPKIDIAAVQIATEVLMKRGIKFNYFRSNEEHIADRKKAVELDITEDDPLYVLGFPMGLVGGERNYVIVRQGIIARIKDTLIGSTQDFLIDAFTFPGNSGGPVVTRPEFTVIEGTKPKGHAYLVGVVKAFVPYRDVAVSEQTKRPRVVFEDNSGLTIVVPIDFVKEIIEEVVKNEGKEETA